MATTNIPSLDHSCDVLVIGGGPAGSSISALLAEKGWHVEVLEKACHPRFHIGESLLPYTLSFLERLGIREQIEHIGLKKYGAELISPYHDKPLTLYFSQAMNKSYPYAYQVRRSEFDEILLRNSTKNGAKVHEGIRASKVEFCKGNQVWVTGIDANNNQHRWTCRFLVDATGRDTFLSHQLGLKRRNTKHNSAAIFGHFEGVQRHSGTDEGNITLAWFEHGWFWIIPFKDGITSIGAVCWPSYLKTREANLDQFLWSTIAHCPPIADRLKTAKLINPAVATGNYSYEAKHMTGDNYIIIGDAFAFIDPVFSTGVHLALNSAIQGATLVDAFLQNAPNYPKLRKKFQQTIQQSLKQYSWFIRRFTQPAFRNMLMAPKRFFRMQEAILSMLAGDIFRDTPTRLPIFLFKMTYCISMFFSLKSNLKAYKTRKQGVMFDLPTRHLQ
jgi:flavin-dependent dehydrogenase